MEKLSIEEKAKAYDKALKVLHKYDGANIMFSQSLKEEMFPELKQNEDERISEEIINYLSTVEDKELIPYKIWIAWIKKQSEQKTIEWNGEDENKFKIVINALVEDYEATPELINWFKSIKERVRPKQGEQISTQTNERAWLYLVADVLTWKDGIGQYLDNPRVQELAKKLHSEYEQKL